MQEADEKTRYHKLQNIHFNENEQDSSLPRSPKELMLSSLITEFKEAQLYYKKAQSHIRFLSPSSHVSNVHEAAGHADGDQWTSRLASAPSRPAMRRSYML